MGCHACISHKKRCFHQAPFCFFILWFPCSSHTCKSTAGWDAWGCHLRMNDRSECLYRAVRFACGCGNSCDSHNHLLKCSPCASFSHLASALDEKTDPIPPFTCLTWMAKSSFLCYCISPLSEKKTDQNCSHLSASADQNGSFVAEPFMKVNH